VSCECCEWCDDDDDDERQQHCQQRQRPLTDETRPFIHVHSAVCNAFRFYTCTLPRHDVRAFMQNGISTDTAHLPYVINPLHMITICSPYMNTLAASNARFHNKLQ